MISLNSTGIGTWICPILVFVTIPLWDFIFKVESDQFDETNNPYYDFLLYLQIPIQFGLIILFLNQIHHVNLSVLELIGMTLSMGINCGVIGINVAHELGHRKTKIEQLMAKLLLTSSLYYQFFIDHNKGHHKHVSTPNDPSSAALNQNLYSFIIESLIGTFRSALRIDKKEMFFGLIFQTIFLLIIFLEFNFQTTLYFICAATVGFTLLECVNYIEHYGLERKRNLSGRYEKVQPAHSWNSNHLVGRGVLFNLSRHSDHHHMVNKKYQQLRNLKEAPQMPTGYPGMIILSLIPPLWFKVMNKKISTLV